MPAKPSPRPSSNIPEARARLHDIAFVLRGDPATAVYAAAIETIIIELMRRRYSDVPVAPTTLGALTPRIAQEVRRFKKANPLASQAEIGRHFGIGAGRVSEALAGHNHNAPSGGTSPLSVPGQTRMPFKFPPSGGSSSSKP